MAKVWIDENMHVRLAQHAAAHTFVVATPWHGPLPVIDGHEGQAFVVTAIFVRGLEQRYGRRLVLHHARSNRLIADVPLDCRVGARVQDCATRSSLSPHVSRMPGVGVRIAKGILLPPSSPLRVVVIGSDGDALDVELDGLFPRDVA